MLGLELPKRVVSAHASRGCLSLTPNQTHFALKKLSVSFEDYERHQQGSDASGSVASEADADATLAVVSGFDIEDSFALTAAEDRRCALAFADGAEGQDLEPGEPVNTGIEPGIPEVEEEFVCSCCDHDGFGAFTSCLKCPFVLTALLRPEPRNRRRDRVHGARLDGGASRLDDHD
jgi:hypothetical protein